MQVGLSNRPFVASQISTMSCRRNPKLAIFLGVIKMVQRVRPVPEHMRSRMIASFATPSINNRRHAVHFLLVARYNSDLQKMGSTYNFTAM